MPRIFRRETPIFSSLEEEKKESIETKEDKEKKNAKIIIIGAGLAGCSAFHYLRKAGFTNLSIFEASERVGGRTMSAYLDGQTTIELGAELIGSNHPRWIALAREYGLSLNLLTPEEYYRSSGCSSRGITASGKEFDLESISSEFDRVRDEFARDAVKIKDPHSPWNHRDRKSLKNKLDSLHLSKKARECIEAQFLFDNLSSSEEQSYLSVLCQLRGGSPNGDGKSFWDCEQVYRCAEGTQQLSLRMVSGDISKTTNKDEDVKKKEERVTFKKELIRLENQEAFFQDGSSEKYDFCVLAIPPTQYSKIEGLKISSPENSFGKVEKFFQIFSDRKEWFQKGLSPNSLDCSAGETWETTENTTSPYKILVQFGIDSKRTRIFPFNEIMSTDWNSNQFIQGGYSFVRPGGMKKIKEYQDYSTENVFLAGEHTSPVFFGFMEGALESGYRVSRMITSASKIEKVSLPETEN
jgi:monoamine oxidase